jgi:hypothetical protein
MRHTALPTAPMGQLLLAIARDEEDEESKDKGSDQGKKAAGDNPADAAHAPTPQSAASAPDATRKRKLGKEAESHPVWSLLSSHPETVKRATELEQGHAPHCAKK